MYLLFIIYLFLYFCIFFFLLLCFVWALVCRRSVPSRVDVGEVQLSQLEYECRVISQISLDINTAFEPRADKRRKNFYTYKWSGLNTGYIAQAS